jgi:hypothetical protein
MLHFNPKHNYSLKLFDWQNYFVGNGKMMPLNELVYITQDLWTVTEKESEIAD